MARSNTAFAHAPTFTEPADPSGANLPISAGRPKGSTSPIYSTKAGQNEAKTFALSILRSEDYRQSLLSRAKAGTLPANIEAMLWAYAYGRPTERVEVTHVSPASQMADMPVEELAKRAEVIAKVLKEVGDIEAADQALKMMHEADEKRIIDAVDAEIIARSEGTVQ